MKNLLSLLLYLALLSATILTARAEFYERGRQMMICHRTANRDVPENTLESLEECALLGADIVEIDIRRTLDGELVLLHDGPIDRVSSGAGDVEQMLAAEFDLYDAGSWMNQRFSGLRHPRLDEALRLSRRLGLKLTLDLKSKGITRQVYDAVKEEGMLDQVRFVGNARDIQSIDPAMNAQQTTAWKPGMTTEDVSELQKQGLFVIATFSANPHELDLPMMREAAAAGVDAINTDHPRLAADALDRSVEAKVLELRRLADQGTGIERSRNLLKLARYRDFDLTAYFADKLHDTDSTVSRAAAIALVRRARPDTVKVTLAARSGDIPDPVRRNQAWVIGMLPEQADDASHDFLLGLLDDSAVESKAEALLALAKIPGALSTDRIVAHVHNDSGLVSGAAALALARHDPVVADRLIPSLARRLRQEIEKTWRQYASPIETKTPLAKSRTTFERPTDPDIPNREALMARAVDLYGGYHKMLAAAAMVQSESSTDWLHDELERYSDDFSNFASYIAAYQLWDRADHERLVRALTARHPFIRDRAQWTLTKSGPAAASALRRALDSSDRDTRLRAAQTLAWIGDSEALPQLENLQGQSGSDASHYAWAIAKIKQVNQITESSSQP